jgi:hypothetical protein
MATLTQNLNYLQPTNFKVVIDHSKFGNLEFFAQRVIHPGITISSPNLPYLRVATVPLPGDTLTFEDLAMDVLVDENLKTYTEVFNLLTSMVQKNVESPLDNRRTDLTFTPTMDITLTITSSHNNVIKTIRYIDCVPTSIGTILLEATSDTSPVITFPVQFSIGYYEIK